MLSADMEDNNKEVNKIHKKQLLNVEDVQNILSVLEKLDRLKIVINYRNST